MRLATKFSSGMRMRMDSRSSKHVYSSGHLENSDLVTFLFQKPEGEVIQFGTAAWLEQLRHARFKSQPLGSPSANRCAAILSLLKGKPH